MEIVTQNNFIPVEKAPPYELKYSRNIVYYVLFKEEKIKRLKGDKNLERITLIEISNQIQRILGQSTKIIRQLTGAILRSSSIALLQMLATLHKLNNIEKE